MARKGAGTTGRSAPAKARSVGTGSLERLHDSIDAAQAALKDVRSEMSRGSRELLKDVEVTLRDARKNLRRVSGRVSKDLEEVQQALRGQAVARQRKPTRRKPAQRKAGGRARSAGATKRSASKR